MSCTAQDGIDMDEADNMEINSNKVQNGFDVSGILDVVSAWQSRFRFQRTHSEYHTYVAKIRHPC